MDKGILDSLGAGPEYLPLSLDVPDHIFPRTAGLLSKPSVRLAMKRGGVKSGSLWRDGWILYSVSLAAISGFVDNGSWSSGSTSSAGSRAPSSSSEFGGVDRGDVSVSCVLNAIPFSWTLSSFSWKALGWRQGPVSASFLVRRSYVKGSRLLISAGSAAAFSNLVDLRVGFS